MLKSYFEHTGIFTAPEIEGVLPLFREQGLKKSAYFIREGERCREIAFIASGIFRSCYSSGQGDEITYCFRFPNEFMTAYSAFITGVPSQETLQALTDAELYIIRKEDLDRISEGSYSWTRFLRRIAEEQYIEMEQRVFQLQKQNAAGRYHSLIRNRPEYIRYIPLQYLASYLGITQRHLSRIRREGHF